MKDLSNNPWFIGGLCAVALLYLAYSVGPSIFGNGPSASGAAGVDVPPLDVFGLGSQTSNTTEPAPNRGHGIGDRTNIAWLDEVARDPFAQPTKQIPEVSGQQTQQQPRRQRQARALPKLTALFVGRGIEAAVLDDRLLNVGDRINGYTLVKIERHQVQLRRNQTSYWLEPGV